MMELPWTERGAADGRTGLGLSGEINNFLAMLNLRCLLDTQVETELGNWKFEPEVQD